MAISVAFTALTYRASAGARDSALDSPAWEELISGGMSSAVLAVVVLDPPAINQGKTKLMVAVPYKGQGPPS